MILFLLRRHGDGDGLHPASSACCCMRAPSRRRGGGAAFWRGLNAGRAERKEAFFILFVPLYVRFWFLAALRLGAPRRPTASIYAWGKAPPWIKPHFTVDRKFYRFRCSNGRF